MIVEPFAKKTKRIELSSIIYNKFMKIVYCHSNSFAHELFWYSKEIALFGAYQGSLRAHVDNKLLESNQLIFEFDETLLATLARKMM